MSDDLDEAVDNSFSGELPEEEWDEIEQRDVLPLGHPAPPKRFPAGDLEKLFWYYEFGVRRMEWPSNMGRQLERIQFLADRMRPCTDCGGDRKKWIGGTGFVWSSKEHQQKKMLEDLGLLKASGAVGDLACPTCCPKPKTEEEKHRPYAPGWVLGGRRATGPITARPTGSSKKGSGVPETGGSQNLALIGWVTRMMQRVAARDAIAAQWIATYCAPDGRSLASLWHLVPAGKTMLRKKPDTLTQRQFFENERAHQKDNPNATREKQHRAADDQVEKVWEKVVKVWCEVRAEQESRR